MTKRIIRLIAGLFLGILPILAFFKFIRQDINIDLDTVDRITETIREKGITNTSSVAGGKIPMNSRVFYIRLDHVYPPLGVYRKGQDYNEYDQLLQVGDTVTVYYRDHPSSSLNLDVYQIEKNGQVMVDYTSYSNNHQVAAAACLVAGLLITSLAIIGYRKRWE